MLRKFINLLGWNTLCTVLCSFLLKQVYHKLNEWPNIGELREILYL